MKNSPENNPWPSRIISLVFALLLFSFVQYENNSRIQSTSPSNGASITSVEVLTDVPIGINIDQDRYFVSGMPETATVRLEGSQAILTQTLATRNFDIETPNLNQLGPGTHEIHLQAEGISDQLNYSIMPSEVTITIEEKVIREFDVNVDFDPSYLEDGYQAGTPQLSNDSVVVTGAASVIDQIDQVTVHVAPESETITEDINMSLPVLVYDAAGELLNVNIEPSEIDVYIPVEGTQKSLPVALRIVGAEDEELDYTVELAQGEPDTVTVTGDQETLESMDNYVLEVDVSGVTESTLRSIPLPAPDGVTEVSPTELDVVIRVSQSSASSEVDSEEDTSSEAENSESQEDTTEQEETNPPTDTSETNQTDESNDADQNDGAASNQQPDDQDRNDQ